MRDINNNNINSLKYQKYPHPFILLSKKITFFTRFVKIDLILPIDILIILLCNTVFSG